MTSLFLSTLSLRRATHGHCAFRHAVDISIHALLAESDVVTRSGSMRYLDFYPRSPCGERLRDQFDVAMSGAFLSTLSLRRATARYEIFLRTTCNFYPRSPCGERLVDGCVTGNTVNFYPRSPCGERRVVGSMMYSISKFLSTLSLRRATKPQTFYWRDGHISIHALLAESDFASPFSIF